ncbi:MAG: hypothetical protein HOC70_00960 [Gammaproteobacteria bacterium]|nr:hypothetical protein [Gammaproteobacteria bacterium]MBT4491783.1 hypothetical protein [Gammaproteobacteria bacterium]MBT7372208.1 hypothetical protein [Gammaproteobacteria bacterium]
MNWLPCLVGAFIISLRELIAVFGLGFLEKYTPANAFRCANCCLASQFRDAKLRLVATGGLTGLALQTPTPAL